MQKLFAAWHFAFQYPYNIMYSIINIPPIFYFLLAAKAMGPGVFPKDDTSPCLPSLPVFRNHPGPAAIGNGEQAIFSSLEIKCNGHVTAWSAYTKGNEESTIHFQVWRRVSLDAMQYSLVGENVLVNTRPINNFVTMDVDSEEFIQVVTGDIIGLYQVASTGKGARIKTKHDRQSKMWHYKSPISPPSLGTHLELSYGNQLLLSKEEIPIIAVTIVQASEFAAPTTTLPQSSLPRNMLKPTNSPSGTKSSTTTTGQDLTQSNVQQLNNEEQDCSSENNSTFLILIVLAMTIAILLLVVFILGTALVLVSLKLRNANENRTARDTYVGKQVVLIEEGHCRKSNFTQNNNHRPIANNESIDNPSYRDHDNRNACNSGNNRNDDQQSYNRLTSVTANTAESTAGRGRTDSSSTVSTRGLNAHEYEDPQTYTTQAGREIPAATYSHPRNTKRTGTLN